MKMGAEVKAFLSLQKASSAAAAQEKGALGKGKSSLCGSNATVNEYKPPVEVSRFQEPLRLVSGNGLRPLQHCLDFGRILLTDIRHTKKDISSAVHTQSSQAFFSGIAGPSSHAAHVPDKT